MVSLMWCSTPWKDASELISIAYSASRLSKNVVVLGAPGGVARIGYSPDVKGNDTCALPDCMVKFGSTRLGRVVLSFWAAGQSACSEFHYSRLSSEFRYTAVTPACHNYPRFWLTEC